MEVHFRQKHDYYVKFDLNCVIVSLYIQRFIWLKLWVEIANTQYIVVKRMVVSYDLGIIFRYNSRLNVEMKYF